MKKPTKKLVLAGETIRHLRDIDLARLHGGLRPISRTSCTWTDCEPPTLEPVCTYR